MDFSTFSKQQKDNYDEMRKIEARLEDLMADGNFTLKPEVRELMAQEEAIILTCHHIYENGQCVICGSMQVDQ